MQYQDCVGAEQVAAGAPESATSAARRLADANINPLTGLATDYLNHFNEAIMLLEMLSSCPDCLDDFLTWRPVSYREHFMASRFRGRDLAIAAYDEHWKQKQPEMDRIFSAQIPPLERLTKWCEYVYEGQKEKSKKYGHVCGCPYASIGVEVATQDDKIRAKVEELMARGGKYVENAIAEAQREGSLAAGDAKPLAQQVCSYVLGTVLRAKIQNDVEALCDLAPTVMAIIGAKSANAIAA